MAFEFFDRQRECRFYTAFCVNKMVVSVTGPRAVNELGGPVIPGNVHPLQAANCCRNSRLVVDEDDLMWFKITENCHVLVNQFNGNFRSKTPSCRKIKYVSRDVK